MSRLKISTEDLRTGMYVWALDRPWTDTPYPLQGFQVEKASEVEHVQGLCEYVYIDTRRGTSLGDPAINIAAPATKKRQETYTRVYGGRAHHANARRESRNDSLDKGQVGAGRLLFKKLPMPVKQVEYEDATPVEDELVTAKEMDLAITKEMARFTADAKEGKVPDIQSLRRVLTSVESSILRNPDAFVLLRQLKSKDEYAYSHSINMSVLAIAFGRHLGLGRDQVQALGLGALLGDIGKVNLPEALLSKPGNLDVDEVKLVQTHVAEGLEIVSRVKRVPGEAKEVIASHHERINGTGYPHGLKGRNIPMFGRMVGIIDTFDAMTSRRPYAERFSAENTVRQLYLWRGSAFQSELVESFIQMLGVYAVGSLVELTNGEVGIVIGQNRARRLRPKVMLLLDEEKQPLEGMLVRDLLTEEFTSDGRALHVLHSLDPGAYGLDPADYYL